MKSGQQRRRLGKADPEWQAKTRKKIQDSHVVRTLIDHVVKGTDLKPSQVTAGLGLMKKICPDLTSTELSSPDGKPVFAVNIHEKQE